MRAQKKLYGRNQKHNTEETEEAEDFGRCVAGENWSQAAEILVDRSTEETEGMEDS
jgi:hypothetical protein